MRWADIDRLGHVNHVSYHEYLEEARCTFITSRLGMDPRDYVLARIELNHVTELRRSAEQVTVLLRIERVGTSSIELSHDILNGSRDLVARGSSVLVAWDGDRREKRTLSADEKARLK